MELFTTDADNAGTATNQKNDSIKFRPPKRILLCFFIFCHILLYKYEVGQAPLTPANSWQVSERPALPTSALSYVTAARQ